MDLKIWGKWANRYGGYTVDIWRMVGGQTVNVRQTYGKHMADIWQTYGKHAPKMVADILNYDISVSQQT